MRNSLLRMLTTLMCVLAACAEVTPVKDFSLEKMAGKWFSAGIATDAQWFVSNKAGMTTGTTVAVPTEGGNLELSNANLNADGTCWRVTHNANKTDTPGRFTFHSHAWNNDNDLRIVDVVYDDYALVHTVKTQNGVAEVLITLYSRTQGTSDNVQQKFIQFSLANGIQADNIVILPKNAECPEV